ncbi:hypothetical protein DUNSADRAFT_2435 [Dunaliella salina]|uniref:RRM domain-containing protein n=1 Tax=Dunaliella salina TaxID=3046 RepID=A0ABQ7GVN4_DUNSA|nr:hypothetical protein DUNSADRAFT_2435 [Dunaliella salina]|eukprot:KAF5838671.1 hypothetical protein DUNSADRAFT_2435 [Dunaliella salina]
MAASSGYFTVDPATQQPIGPYDRVSLQKLLADGYVKKETPLWKEGMPEWQPLAEIPELEPLVQVTEELHAKTSKKPAADPGDELATFKAEIQALEGKAGEETNEAEGAAEDKGKSGTQTPEELEFEDDDGTKYVWDRSQRKYMPKATSVGAAPSYDPEIMTYVPEEEAIPSLDAAIKGEAGAEEAAATEERKRKGKEASPSGQGGKAQANEQAAKKQKKGKGQPATQPSEWFELKNNTNVYVAGLPLDVTMEEIHAAFSKFGLIKEDENKQPRIKMYRDRNTGQLKGDALVSFLKAPSVTLAVNLMDGTPLRPGDNKNMVAIVQRQEQRLGWGGYDDKAPPEKVTVIIYHMFGPKELSEDLEAAEDLEKEVLAEATKLGPVEKVRVFKDHPDGVVSVKYKTDEGAAACLEKMNGRFFGGRQLRTAMWDGITNFAIVKVQETPEEEEARLERFARELEGQEDGKKLPENQPKGAALQ